MSVEETNVSTVQTDDGAAAESTSDTNVATPDTGTTDTGVEGADGGNTDGADAGGDAGDAESSGQNGAPESYAEFTMPEGVEVDSEMLETASAMFKEDGLSQEQSQKYVDMMAAKVQSITNGQVEAFNQQVSEWAEQSKNDKEFGGDKFDQSVATARRAIDKFGTPELNKLLNDHGVGSHPEVIRFMKRVGDLTTEDNPGGITSQAGNKSTSGHASEGAVDVLYGPKS